MESSPHNLGYASEESYGCKQTRSYNCGEQVSLSSLTNVTIFYGLWWDRVHGEG